MTDSMREYFLLGIGGKGPPLKGQHHWLSVVRHPTFESDKYSAVFACLRPKLGQEEEGFFHQTEIRKLDHGRPENICVRMSMMW